MQLQVIVPRDSREESTLAVVRADVTAKVAEPVQLREAIVTAVTRWVRETDAGRQAWVASSRDYNIGDMASDLADEELLARLAEEGVVNLAIDIVTATEKPIGWTYDEVLVDELELGEDHP